MNNSQIHINHLSSIHARVKQQLFEFEMRSFKTKAKILQNQKILKEAFKEVEDYRTTKMYGFNNIAFFLGMATYHSIYLLFNKQMLSELDKLKVRNHLVGTILIGTVSGYGIGYKYGKHFNAYFKYRKIMADLEEMNKKFENYYILNKEQQFDD
jgi:hypothetical protein